MQLRRYHLFLGLAVVLVAAAVAILPGRVSAYSTSNLQLVDFAGYGDQVENYDFSSESVSSSNVEWPIDLIFYNNAFIDGVKSDLQGISPSFYVPGTTEYAYMINRYLGTGWVWDQDGGMKTGFPTCTGSTAHYRIYAPSALDAFYNPNFGYYDIASTHEDIDELPGCDAHYNYSENVEYAIAYQWSLKGHQAYYDEVPMSNAQYNLEGNHHFDSDGAASLLRIPGGGGGGCLKTAPGSVLSC
jgi:hypothetical protein